jgi:hypothetical protein
LEWLEREKIGEKPLSFFLFSTDSSINVNRNATPQGKVMEICHVFANSHWAMLPPLLLAGEGYSGICQRLSYSL